MENTDYRTISKTIQGILPYDVTYIVYRDKISQKNWQGPTGTVDYPSMYQRSAEAFQEIFWMARRYADGRMTYAASTYNDAVRKALSVGITLPLLGDGTVWARDGHGRQCDHLSDDEAAMGKEVDVWGLIKNEEIETLKERIKKLEFENECLQRVADSIQASHTVNDWDNARGTHF